MSEHGVIMQTVLGDIFLLFQTVINVAIKQPKFRRAIVIPVKAGIQAFQYMR